MVGVLSHLRGAAEARRHERERYNPFGVRGRNALDRGGREYRRMHETAHTKAAVSLDLAETRVNVQYHGGAASDGAVVGPDARDAEPFKFEEHA